MSAEVETMFSVRETPWHGLGYISENYPESVDQALVWAGLDWKVGKYPVYTGLSQDNIEKIPDFYSNIREKDGKVLGIVGNNYKIVQNVEAFDFCNNLMDGQAKFETAGSLYEGKKVWALLKLEDFNVLGDSFENYLYVVNSFDGKGAIRAGLTPIRVVCKNTLNLALNKTSRSWRVTHNGDLDSKIQEASKALDLANKYTKALAEEAEKLASIKVSDIELFKMTNYLFPINDKMSDRQKGNVEKERDGFLSVYRNTSDIANFRGTGWGILQAVTDYTQHSEPLRKSSTYKAKLFESVIDGQEIVDKAYERLLAIA